MNSNNREELKRPNFKRETELRMSTILKFKYYSQHIMSRKFVYRYNKISINYQKYSLVDLISKSKLSKNLGYIPLDDTGIDQRYIESIQTLTEVQIS